MKSCCAATSVCMCSAPWGNVEGELKLEAEKPRYHVPQRAKSFKVTSVCHKMAPCAEEIFHVVLSPCPADLQPQPGAGSISELAPEPSPVPQQCWGIALVCAGHWQMAGLPVLVSSPGTEIGDPAQCG